jgi:hypothetical protein
MSADTYWNGLPMPAERVRVVVDTAPVHTWWCAALAGTERAAVRVGEPGGEVTYLDDEDGSGWWKVTEGRGSSRVPHRSLPVVREAAGAGPAQHPTRDQVAEVLAKSQNADYWVDEIREWEAREDWERTAYAEDRPDGAYEDRDSYLADADAVLALFPKEAARG